MVKGKELTIYILEQYEEHCQTTVDGGDKSDLQNLKDVKTALKWVRSK